MGEFFDLSMSGKVFSWYGPENKRSRIDQFLVSCGWINNFRDLCQRGLSKSVLDHIPISLVSELIDCVTPRPERSMRDNRRVSLDEPQLPETHPRTRKAFSTITRLKTGL